MIEGVETDDVRGQHALEQVFPVGQSPAATDTSNAQSTRPKKKKSRAIRKKKHKVLLTPDLQLPFFHDRYLRCYHSGRVL